MPVARPGWRAVASASLMAALLPVSAGQLKSSIYYALDRGMSESELLVRAGEPDLVTYPGGVVISRRSAVGAVGGDDRRLGLIGGVERTRYIEIKEYHYIPDYTEHDPHLTVVTLRAGRVFDIERTKLLTRPSRPSGELDTESQPRMSDQDIRIEQIDRVLSAAEAYAETRARLKGNTGTPDESLAPEASAPGVYRDTSPDGVPYFGDRPMED